ncbi:diguanylate cyclase (GGDEF)-like protein [Pseudoduganella lurida]|uniref:Diguanylate cyclase (GGDEF)-like protein n=1 Tax=Pseudoduganella lurida TaxID=1036180 RepID=A0A562RM31_9BURK|nr:sensor domain-containing diguanylate cyclase [Pseudoduganella lurida]TWI69510.1 diguanylate cyclase (GGDEF)-like protein [Pseudoduganella lurida]
MKRLLLPRTLRFRMTLVVSLLVLLATLLVSALSLGFVGWRMKEVVGKEQLALLSSAAAGLDQDFGMRQALLRTIAEGLADRATLTAADLQADLEKHPTLREEFFNVIVFDTAGTVVANLGDRRALGSRIAASRAYFAETLRAREGVISAPLRSTLSGKPIVLITQPVFDGAGKVRYVLGAAVNLANGRLLGHFEAARPGNTGYLFLVDGTGTILIHPNRDRILKRMAEEEGGVTPTMRAALAGFEGWTEGVTKSGEEALMAYRRVHRTNWIIGAVYPVDEAFAPVIEAERASWLAAGLVALLAGGCGLWATRRLLHPLMQLRGAVGRITAGTADIAVLDSARPDEVGELSRAFYRLSEQRRAAEQQLALLTRTDVLTGINNRRMFESELPAALARAARADTGIVLACIDVDHFKAINDTHGHPVGDRVLVEFAQRLRAGVRVVDIVARLAGDEFVVIFECVRTEEQVAVLAAKLQAAFRQPFDCGGRLLAVSASVGFAHAVRPADSEAMLKAADAALYQAKEAGRNTWALVRVGDEAVQPRSAAG